MTLTYRDGVSIGMLIVYSAFLIVATILVFKHGFKKSAGWFYLVIFCLARIIGPAMQLATISDPTSVSLYIGYAVLNNVGLSPLMLCTIGLLNRLLDNIHETHNTKLHPWILKGVQLLILVGLILGIVGGTNAGGAYAKSVEAGNSNAGYQTGTLSKVGVALFVVSYAAIVAFTMVISFYTPHAATGEKRLCYAVAIALPFLLIRLIYSCVSVYASDPRFNLLTGSETILFCMAYLMEILIVLVFEAMGLSLRKVVRTEAPVENRQYSSDGSDMPEKKKDNLALKLAKKTIIGRIVMALMPKKERDVERQG